MTRVVVNGSFDLLHIGHLRLLAHARSYPNSYVLVLTDSDRRIRELKGPARPVNSEQERVEFLSALRYVDRVMLFDSDQDLEALIKDFAPDVMVKGSDYRGKEIIGQQYCKDIYFYDRLKEYSSTKKIQDIANRR